MQVAPASCGVVRRRPVEAAEGRIVSGPQGLPELLGGTAEVARLRPTLEAVGPILDRYLAMRGRTFEAEVRRKRARLLSVTGFLDAKEAA